LGILEADDLFQETMIRAFKSADTFKSDGLTDAKELQDKVDAWLGVIAENILIDWLRRRPKLVALDPGILEENCPRQNDEPAVDPDTEEIGLVREAIESLPPKQQAVMWATSLLYERRTHQRTPTVALDEIVESLGMSRESYRKHKERARNKIREHLAKHSLRYPEGGTHDLR